MRKAREAGRQVALPGLELPRSEGFMSALLGPGSPPEDGRRLRPFEVQMGDQVLTFWWSPQCKCCAFLRDPRGEGPRHADGPAVYQEIVRGHLGMETDTEVHLRVMRMTEGWPEEDRPSYDGLRHHLRRHLPVELQVRNQVAARAAAVFHAKSLVVMNTVGLLYFANRVALQEAAEAVMRGELRPRTIQDLRTLAEIGLTLERDYLGSSAEASEWLAFAYKMDQAIADVLPQEWKERVQARFRELERQGDRLRERVRTAGAEMAAPGEGVLAKALESLDPSTGDGASDGDRRPSSPGGGGGPGGVAGPRAAGAEAQNHGGGFQRDNPTYRRGGPIDPSAPIATAPLGRMSTKVLPTCGGD